VQVLKPVDGFFKDAFDGQIIVVKDQVLTHQDSRVKIDLSNGTMFRVGPFSTFILEEMEDRDEGPFARLKLDIGRIWIILRGGAVDVETPSGLASVRGSYLYVEVIPGVVETENETQITCLEGVCTLECEGGEVVLGPGESATITNILLPPVEGKMSDEDVSEWIAMNPEATMVVQPLTATPTPIEDGSVQGEHTSTPTMTPTPTPTPTPTGELCGPPSDWVLILVESGDTLAEISAAYGVSIADLQYANCLGDSTVIDPGTGLYVPNAPTITPTPIPTNTSTPKPTAASTNAPTKTNTPTSTPVPADPTSTPTPTNTVIPSDSNAVFFNQSGPTGSINDCLNFYKTDVIDPDGITAVKLFYVVDPNAGGTKTEPANGDYVIMDYTGGNSYSKANFKIPTANNIGTDMVYYRFKVYDSLGYTQYYPDLSSTPYSYSDSMDCGTPVNYPTNFSSHAGPDGITINSQIECENTYYINVDDANGVLMAELAYSLDGGSSYSYLIMTPHTVDGSGNGTYEIITKIDATGKSPPLTVKYKFKAKDGLSTWSFDSTIYSFTDTVICVP
jgi:LysM repeat protein